MTPAGRKFWKTLMKLLAVLVAVGVLLVLGVIGVVTYDCVALGMCP